MMIHDEPMAMRIYSPTANHTSCTSYFFVNISLDRNATENLEPSTHDLVRISKNEGLMRDSMLLQGNARTGLMKVFKCF